MRDDSYDSERFPAHDTHCHDDYDWYSRSSDAAERSVYLWKQPGIADAYNSDVPPVHQRDAQRRLHALCAKLQRQIARLLGQLNRDFVPKVPIQLGFFFTTSPRQMCARACLGQSALLEYQERQSDALVLTVAEPFIKSPAIHDKRYEILSSQVDQQYLERLLREVSQVVQIRIMMEALRRQPRVGQLVEWARIFGADHLTLDLPTLFDVISAVTLYGDIIPEWRTLNPHPTTLTMLQGVHAASRDYFARLLLTTSDQLTVLGLEWIKELGYVLAQYLPPPRDESAKEQAPNREPHALAPSDGTTGFRYRHPGQSGQPHPASVPPLRSPSPPLLIERGKMEERAAIALGASLRESSTDTSSEADPQSQRLASAVEKITKAMSSITKPASNWEDPAFDLIEQKIRMDPYGRSPIEGAPQDGHEVKMMVAGKDLSGDIHEEVVAPSAGIDSCDRLRREADPITRALKPLLFPSVDDHPLVETGLTSGRLDGLRLYRAAYSNAIFKRAKVLPVADQGGAPVLMIVLDASGSIGAAQMRLTKVLAAAFVIATQRTDIKVLCALYNQARPVGKLVSGAIIKWLYHPLRSIARTTHEALTCLESVPDAGSGGQEDAISLQFCLSEARRLAGNQSIFLIHISDTAWCKSFMQSPSAAEEVRTFYAAAQKELKDKFHSTLIALGTDNRAQELKDVVDSIITVTRDELGNYRRVAEKVSTYVATCMQQRQRLIEAHRRL